MTTTTRTAGQIIADQIGRRAFLMMGSKAILWDDLSLLFDIKGCRAINKIRVTLDPALDLYRVEFFKLKNRGLDCVTVREFSGVYADQLRGLIESETGLYLSL